MKRGHGATDTHIRLDNHTFKHYHTFVFTLKHIILHSSQVHSHRNMPSHTHILNSPPMCIHSNTPMFTLTHCHRLRHAHTETRMQTNLNYLFILTQAHTQTHRTSHSHTHTDSRSHMQALPHTYSQTYHAFPQVHTHMQAHPPTCLHMIICTCIHTCFYTCLLKQTLMHTHMSMYLDPCTFTHTPSP